MMATQNSTVPEVGKTYRMASGGVHVRATFVSFGSHNGAEDQKWSLVEIPGSGRRLEMTEKLMRGCA